MIGICQSTPNFGYYDLDLLLFRLEWVMQRLGRGTSYLILEVVYLAAGSQVLYLHRLPQFDGLKRYPFCFRIWKNERTAKLRIFSKKKGQNCSFIWCTDLLPFPMYIGAERCTLMRMVFLVMQDSTRSWIDNFFLGTCWKLHLFGKRWIAFLLLNHRVNCACWIA